MTSAHTNQVPGLPDINNGNAITTGSKIRFDSNGFVLAIRFWVPATNTGTYTVGLYEVLTDDDPNGSGTGTLLGSASVSSALVVAGDWAEVPLNPVIPVSSALVYCCARHSSSGRYVATVGAFNGTDITNGGVTELATGSDPNPPGLGSLLNGVFNEGVALAYPANNANQPDYFVDVNFSLVASVAAFHSHGHQKMMSRIPPLELLAA